MSNQRLYEFEQEVNDLLTAAYFGGIKHGKITSFIKLASSAVESLAGQL